MLIYLSLNKFMRIMYNKTLKIVCFAFGDLKNYDISTL